MWLFYIFIWVSGWGAGSTITMLSLIKWFPLVISWARHTSQPQCSSLSVWCVSGGRTGVNTEQPSVWRWRCWTTPTDAVSQSVRQVKPASKHSATPPLSSSPSWALPILCVSAWLNGGHISRLHSLWHCMGVNAGRVFLSDSCTLSNPWQQHFLTVLDDHYFGAQFFLWHSCFGYTCASVALYPGYALSSHSQH